MEEVAVIDLLDETLHSVPPTLLKAFENVSTRESDAKPVFSTLFLETLELAILHRPEKKLERYYVLSRLIYSYLGFIYASKNSVNLRDKGDFLIYGKNSLTKDIEFNFKESIQILNANSPKEGRLTSKEKSSGLLQYYDDAIDLIGREIPEFEALYTTSNHFKDKIRSGKHPLFSDYVINSYRLSFTGVEGVAPLVLALESAIHGIDDYVDDTDASYECSFCDVANIIIGLYIVLKYALEFQKMDKYDSIRSILGHPLKVERLLYNLKECIDDLTYTPFVEDSVEEILDLDDIEKEYELAMNNLNTRTKATTRSLTEPVNIILNVNPIDGDNFRNAVWVCRVEEMLYKDILDIENDLANSDFKAPAIWAKRYGQNTPEFRDRIRYLDEFYFSQIVSFDKQFQEKYTDSYKYLANRAKITHENILREIT